MNEPEVEFLYACETLATYRSAALPTLEQVINAFREHTRVAQRVLLVDQNGDV